MYCCILYEYDTIQAQRNNNGLYLCVALGFAVKPFSRNWLSEKHKKALLETSCEVLKLTASWQSCLALFFSPINLQKCQQFNKDRPRRSNNPQSSPALLPPAYYLHTHVYSILLLPTTRNYFPLILVRLPFLNSAEETCTQRVPISISVKEQRQSISEINVVCCVGRVEIQIEI